MSRKGIAVLLVVVCVLVVLAGWAAKSRRAAAPDAALGRLLPDLAAHANEVSRIEMTQGDRTARFARQGDAWVAPDMDDFPVDFAKVRELVVALSTLERDAATTDRPERHGELDLAWPDPEGKARLVRLFAGDAEQPLCAVVLGRQKWSPAGLYVRRLDEDATWRTGATVPFEADATRWMDRAIAAVPATGMTRIRYEDLALVRDADAGTWSVDGEPGADWPEPRVEAARTALPALVASLEFDAVRRADAFDAIGAPAPGVVYELGPTVLTLDRRVADDGTWIRLRAEGVPEGDDAPAWAAKRDAWSAWCWRLPSWKASQFARLAPPPPPEPEPAVEPGADPLPAPEGSDAAAAPVPVPAPVPALEPALEPDSPPAGDG